MNSTIKELFERKSVRVYKDKEIEPENIGVSYSSTNSWKYDFVFNYRYTGSRN